MREEMKHLLKITRIFSKHPQLSKSFQSQQHATMKRNLNKIQFAKVVTKKTKNKKIHKLYDHIKLCVKCSLHGLS